tara:strand:+ start:3391 stop:3816 length:426 start_codon:yes stop_codon:yes gene_type:complete
MSVIGEGISHRGLVSEDFHYPFNVTGTVTAADVGKAVTYDTSAARAVKLAGDGDPVIGVLATFEARSIEGTQVGTVALKGGFRLQKAAGTDAIAIGDTVVGSATAGEVGPRRNAADDANEPDHRINVVTAVDGSNIEVLIL